MPGVPTSPSDPADGFPTGLPTESPIDARRRRSDLYDSLRRDAGLPEEINPATVARIAAMINQPSPPPHPPLPTKPALPEVDRPQRKMPRMQLVEEHWGFEHGRCARCGQPARCEKAHLIDRCYDGLDGPQNLIPLCYPCHAQMPSFRPGDEALAILWAITPSGASELELAETLLVILTDLAIDPVSMADVIVANRACLSR